MGNTYNHNILVIDNDPLFLDEVTTFLRTEGFQHVMIAMDCKTALEIVETYEDVFIITEFIFNTMSGEALIKKLKRRLNGSMKVIVLSKTVVCSQVFVTVLLTPVCNRGGYQWSADRFYTSGFSGLKCRVCVNGHFYAIWHPVVSLVTFRWPGG